MKLAQKVGKWWLVALILDNVITVAILAVVYVWPPAAVLACGAS